MKAKLESAFPACITNSCIEIETSKIFHILDDEKTKRSYISKGNGIKYPSFTVLNDYERKIHFLAIDACVFSSAEEERCDCAVFDSSVFHFVELKLGGKELTKSERKKKAIDQLKQTISTFRGKISFENYKVKAHVCVGYFAPSPSVQSSDLPSKLHFIKKLKAELLEGNQIIF